VIRSLAAGLHAFSWGLLLANAAYLARTRSDRLRPARWPRVSVLVPARNEAENLRRLIPSLLAQDYPDFEAVVYDDGSEDGTGAVIADAADPRIVALRGEGPPPGWVGKVHALYQATRRATGEVFVFLDADTALTDAGALRRLVERWAAVDAASGGAGGVLSGLPDLRGGGRLLVSLVPFALTTGLPMPFVSRTKMAALGSLNGQCWVIGADAYRRHEPHAAMPAEVLEDVQIGRFVKRKGMRLALRDLGGEVAVWMYGSHAEAWRGFRKNTYLIQGGTPARFVAVHGLYTLMHVLGPLRSRRLAASSWAMKAASDRTAGLPWRLAMLAPVSLLLAAVLPLDSAVSHWRGRVEWKGRSVARQRNGVDRGEGDVSFIAASPSPHSPPTPCASR